MAARQSSVSGGPYLPTCSGCIARQIGACPGYGVRAARNAPRSAGGIEVRSTTQTFPPRRQILHQRELSDVVPVICSGWAAASISTQNGKRQIVSFLLGGDVASINYLFEPCGGRMIEAVSQVMCRKFLRADLQAAAARHPAFLSILGRFLAEERERNDQLGFDRNRRPAESRVARLVLDFSVRMKRHGKAFEDRFEFPVRQRQLGDALGLTAVHVCKIMRRLRDAGIIAVESRHLRILDRQALQAMAEQ